MMDDGWPGDKMVRQWGVYHPQHISDCRSINGSPGSMGSWSYSNSELYPLEVFYLLVSLWVYIGIE
ncbi:hypothetical protein BJX96DRAFT_116323 [Aspergillus floccosus]